MAYGFRTTPYTDPMEIPGEKAHSAMLLFPSTMAPASFSSRTWKSTTVMTDYSFDSGPF